MNPYRPPLAPARPRGRGGDPRPGLQGKTGAVTSQAFVADAELSGQKGSELFAETTVKSDVNPGTYDVSVTCDGRDHAASGRAQVVRNLSAKAPAHEPTDLRTPVAPVRAGGGGAAALTAARRSWRPRRRRTRQTRDPAPGTP